MIAVADQRPGIELTFIGGRHPYREHRLRPEAMEVAQGHETQFYDCPQPGAVGVICVDGAWHWQIDS